MSAPPRRFLTLAALVSVLGCALGCAGPNAGRRPSPAGPAAPAAPDWRDGPRGRAEGPADAPAAGPGVPDEASPPAAGPCDGWSGTHVVARGETMWRIARRHGVALDDLARCNGVPDPTRIDTGRTLAVPATASPARFLWPVRGRISSAFGPRRGRLHRGIDVRAPRGTSIRAARRGRVAFSGGQRGYGNVVILAHDDGYETVYAHNAKNLVRRGDRVDPGDVIALVGRTGNATAPHVHFEVRRHRRPVDPLLHLGPRTQAASGPAAPSPSGSAASPVR